MAILREQAVADFQRCWRTLERLEAAALPADSKTVQNLREGLALLMNQLAALMTDSE